MKSVIAGEYTAPPAHGPSTAEICGIDPRCQRVPEKNLGVAAQRDDALLDARAAGVVEADHRRAVAHRQIHDLADLLRERFGERPAEHGEVLREDVDEPAVDAAVSRDDAVAVVLLVLQPEIARPVHDEAIELHEAAFVEQQVEPLARRQLALRVLGLDATLAAPLLRLGRSALEKLELVSHGHRRKKLRPPDAAF